MRGLAGVIGAAAALVLVGGVVTAATGAAEGNHAPALRAAPAPTSSPATAPTTEAAPATSAALPSVSPTPSAAPTDVPGRPLPAGVGLTDADLTAAHLSGTFAAVDGGDTVDAMDGSTLTECGGTFSSEALRTARHQVLATVTTVAGLAEKLSISSEVVAYRSVAAAAQALTEEQAAVAACKATVPYTNDQVAGGQTDAYSERSANLLSLPAAASETDLFTETYLHDGYNSYYLDYFQVAGPYLDIVYVNGPGTPLTAAAKADGLALAQATGKRLVAAGS